MLEPSHSLTTEECTPGPCLSGSLILIDGPAGNWEERGACRGCCCCATAAAAPSCRRRAESRRSASTISRFTSSRRCRSSPSCACSCRTAAICACLDGEAAAPLVSWPSRPWPASNLPISATFSRICSPILITSRWRLCSTLHSASPRACPSSACTAPVALDRSNTEPSPSASPSPLAAACSPVAAAAGCWTRAASACTARSRPPTCRIELRSLDAWSCSTCSTVSRAARHSSRDSSSRCNSSLFSAAAAVRRRRSEARSSSGGRPSRLGRLAGSTPT